MSNIVDAKATIKEIDGVLDAIDRLDRVGYNEIRRVYDGATWHLMTMIQEGWITDINGEALEELKSFLYAIKALTLDLWKAVKVGDTIEWWSSKDDMRVSAKVLEIGETSVRVDREWCGKPDSKWVNVFWDNGYEARIIR